jgi:hypothetical protein
MPIGIKRSSESLVEWYVFPFGKPSPSDPTRPVTTLKTAWNNVRTNAQVKGRWHDNRHTLITDLAESGAGDQTIMDIAGHVSKQMLKHYSHIRMEAKRRALESIVTVRPATATAESGQETGQAEGYPQKSPHGLQNVGKPTDRKRATAKTETRTQPTKQICLAQNRPQIRRVLMWGTHTSNQQMECWRF